MNPITPDQIEGFPQFSETLVNKHVYFKMFTATAMVKILESNNLSTLTFQDIKAEFCEEWTKITKLCKTAHVFEHLKAMTATFLNIRPQDREAIFEAEENAPYFEDLGNQADRIVNLALEKFQKENAPFEVVINPDISSCRPKIYLLASMQKTTVVTIKDPKEFEKIRLMSLFQTQPIRSPVEEKKFGMRVALLKKQQTKKSLEKKEKLSEILNDIQKSLSYYLFLSSKLNIELNEITDEEINSTKNINDFEEFQETRNKHLDSKRLLEIEKSFEPVEPVKASKKGKKKKSSTLKPTKPQTVKVPEVVIHTTAVQPSIFDQPIAFFLAKRIVRWFQASFETIKNFEDKVLTTKMHHYQKLTQKQLEAQRIYHRLPGVERLMSLSPMILQRYSTPYQFMHNGVVKNGRCFRATLNYGSKEELGMIYVGIDSQKIYHAQFVPFTIKDRFKANDLCLQLDGCESELSKEEEWQLQGGYAFHREEDLTIVWAIADNTPVEYQIQPLF